MRPPRRRPEPADASVPSAAATATIHRLRAQLQTERALLRQAQGDLQLAARRFRSVFDQQFQFMVILSPQGHVTEISEQLALREGAVPADQIIGRLFWETVWWDHVPEANTLWPARLKQAALADGPLLNEDVFNSSSGEMRVASAAITAVKNAAGEVDCFVVQATDITDTRRAERQRQVLEAQLRETHKLQAIGTLAGGIAHDFNNILGAILGNLALAQQDIDAAHPAQARLAQIRQAGGRARSLVQQILAFSRRQPHDLVVQPLQPVLEETIALLRTTLPASVTIELRLSDEPLWVNADATQIQQVLMNLCTNASFAVGQTLGRIEVGLEHLTLPERLEPLAVQGPPGDNAHLWVRDDGIGMDEATRARIFEPFCTTRGAAEGTGLGLSVVHGIVAEHGGAITVESMPGKGSVFHVVLPLAVGAADTAPVAGRAAPEPHGAGQHVLYVDDDQMMVVMVQGLLQGAGYRVTTCRSALSAVTALREDPGAFDVVVTDFNMPGGSGLDVARAVRALRPGLPVVISSGYLTEELRSTAARAGVRRLLQKENTVEELCALLREVLAEPGA
ncbi:MAG: ATP-binding protein [Burkholderiaceae bacterium]